MSCTKLGWGTSGPTDKQKGFKAACQIIQIMCNDVQIKLCIQEMNGKRFKSFTLEYKAKVGNRIVYALL
jgi:hypothetical protein